MDIKHVLSLNPMLTRLRRGALPAPDTRGAATLDLVSRRHRARSATPASGSASTTSCPGTSPTWIPSPSPTGWSPAATGWRSSTTVAIAGGTVAVRRMGDGPGRGVGIPLYWSQGDDGWTSSPWAATTAVDPAQPVCHISYYEADAFARWAGHPTAHRGRVGGGCERPDPREGRGATTGRQVPRPDQTPPDTRAEPPGEAAPVRRRLAVDLVCLQPVPRIRPRRRSGRRVQRKFMVNQYVLRGGSCVTPSDHIRPTYRNYFPPSARWAFAGLRLARNG